MKEFFIHPPPPFQMTSNNFSTLRDLLRYAVTRFNTAKLVFGHGSSNAFDEAAYLLLHTLKLPIDKLDPFLDARLLPEEIDALLNVIEQRATQRVPAAYITGEAWLDGYRFYVDQRVIVPRSYFAELLEGGFAPWIEDPDAVGATLDLCTGSGCLAILMAHAFPNATLKEIKVNFRNVVRHGDRLTCQGIVTEKGENEEGTYIECDLFIENQRKERKLTGRAKLLL